MKAINGKIFLILSALLCVSAGSIKAQMYKVCDTVDEYGRQARIFSHIIKVKGGKSKTVAYTFTEKRSDISLGCDVFKTDGDVRTPMGFFAVAAYTKDGSDRMNYNSILPYLSVCQAGNRTILSFECPLIVINPDKMNEKITETKNLYGIIKDNAVEINNH